MHDYILNYNHDKIFSDFHFENVSVFGNVFHDKSATLVPDLASVAKRAVQFKGE